MRIQNSKNAPKFTFIHVENLPLHYESYSGIHPRIKRNNHIYRLIVERSAYRINPGSYAGGSLISR
jgi:hypothetical protein